MGLVDKLTSTQAPRAVVLIRLMAGTVFLTEGIQKFLHPVELGAGRFAKIGIPYPEIMGPFIGGVETVFGALILFGLLKVQLAGRIREAHRILRPVGQAAIIHWNPDPATPRGPDMSTRPQPEQCQAWTLEAGVELALPFVSMAPFHFGLVGRKL